MYNLELHLQGWRGGMSDVLDALPSRKSVCQIKVLRSFTTPTPPTFLYLKRRMLGIHTLPILPLRVFLSLQRDRALGNHRGFEMKR